MWEQLQTPRCSSGRGNEARLPPRAREKNFWTEKHCTGKHFHEVPLFISATFVLTQTHKDTISSWGLTACKDRPHLGNLGFILPCFMSKEGFLFFLLSKDTWTLSDLLTFIKMLIPRGGSQHPLSSWEKPSKHQAAHFDDSSPLQSCFTSYAASGGSAAFHRPRFHSGFEWSMSPRSP